MPKLGYKQTEEHKRKNHAKGVSSNALGKRWTLSEEAKKNISNGHKGIATWNKGLSGLYSKEHREKISIGNKGKKRSLETRKKMSESRKKLCSVKENNPRWFKDRSKLKKSEDRRLDVAVKHWRLAVYKRDNYCCKLKNEDCSKNIEAHHILPWRDFPELRYDINNGITLCTFHHPKKYAEEKRLSAYFISLIKKIL